MAMMASNSTGIGENPLPPPIPRVWEKNDDVDVHYIIRDKWKWVMDVVAEGCGMTEVEKASDLPTAKQAKLLETSSSVIATPTKPARRRQKSARLKEFIPSTLKIEVSNVRTGEIEFAAHGTSSAFDGLEDKDELCRTIQRCRCDQLHLSPPSILINWDVTQEECLNVVGKDLPVLDEQKQGENEQTYAVLKEPIGSEGKGIYFVKTVEEIHKTINEHRQRALQEPEFLDDLIAKKGRIPSWVLQAEVRPCLLLRGGRKFHIRSYLVVTEKLHHPDLFDMYFFDRHEVLLAGVPVEENGLGRDPMAHITNGALSNTTERILLSGEPELVNRGIKEKLDIFIAETFAKHFVSDIERRVSYTANQEGDSAGIKKFSVAGVDLMVTEDNRIYLLEVNVNPMAPADSTVDREFQEHLTGFMHDLVDLITGSPSPNFISAFDLLEQRN